MNYYCKICKIKLEIHTQLSLQPYLFKVTKKTACIKKWQSKEVMFTGNKTTDTKAFKLQTFTKIMKPLWTVCVISDRSNGSKTCKEEKDYICNKRSCLKECFGMLRNQISWPNNVKNSRSQGPWEGYYSPNTPVAWYPSQPSRSQCGSFLCTS
jgi:hypothetical protein